MSGESGTARTGTGCALVCASRRSNGNESRGVSASSTGLPHVVASVCASAASSSSSSWARSRSRRGSMIATSADAGSRSGSSRSSEVSHGSHDSMPSKVLPSASRSHCSRPHGWVWMSSRARARTSSVGSSSRTGKIHDSVDFVRRTLVGDGEVREPVDLVAPQVDAHGVIGGGGIDVDDRAPHRDLAARLDLVLAPVTDGDQLRDELVAVDLRALAHDDGLDVLDVRAEPLHQGPDGRDDRPRQVLAARAQPPDDAQAPAHRLGRGRHALERQGLPRGEELDRVVAEELPQVGGDPLGLDTGRHRDHDRTASGGAGQRGREQRPGRLRHRDRARETAGRGGDRRIVGEQSGQPGKGGRHGRAFYPGTRTRPG